MDRCLLGGSAGTPRPGSALGAVPFCDPSGQQLDASGDDTAPVVCRAVATTYRSDAFSLPHPYCSLGHARNYHCLLYTSDAADDLLCVDLGGRRIIKQKKKNKQNQFLIY